MPQHTPAEKARMRRNLLGGDNTKTRPGAPGGASTIRRKLSRKKGKSRHRSMERRAFGGR